MQAMSRLDRIQDGYMTPAEAAARLRVSPITLRHWVNKGVIRASFTAGGHRRYARWDVERLAASRRPGEPQTVLIVDDDVLFANYLRELMHSVDERLNVEYAPDGFEAGRKLIRCRPDVVLLDLVMPGLDGFSVCRRIKSEPDTAHIRVIALTGHPSPEYVQAILSLGAEHCLGKPVDPQTLLTAMGVGSDTALVRP